MAESKLSLAPSPARPTDLTPPALFLSLHNVGQEHVGRKLRLVVQILGLDQSHRATHVLATSHTVSPRPLLLLRVDQVLLGTHPRVGTAEWWRADSAPAPAPRGGAGTSRAELSLRPGEWVTVVGWLETSVAPQRIIVPDGYRPPLDAVLDCINVSMAREPPVGGVCRGDLEVGG
ncbi:hypothetical protein CC85DRAFT_176237 [Cutaneotrichosporon oleaginosum]|uniref:Uncharacterized protein n=1 Tax=Cutaneotrichosporon oleaginosum TaxID=879819 RepID=A0A0J1AX06_9TREE|nr:uncharacterized protein CC85DRAFT_176237 [Cutaneotrichosporon oleaginosum]KLT39839.1 hypothetical protein CC85DRAFT_176237 [Cutaneotrichosporon oleaginosum]TXT05436.1 hypothetical protein COLE_06756 [Cutaneotrichosporon oleaginosum]